MRRPRVPPLSYYAFALPLCLPCFFSLKIEAYFSGHSTFPPQWSQYTALRKSSRSQFSQKNRSCFNSGSAMVVVIHSTYPATEEGNRYLMGSTHQPTNKGLPGRSALAGLRQNDARQPSWRPRWCCLDVSHQGLSIPTVPFVATIPRSGPFRENEMHCALHCTPAYSERA